MNFLQCKNKHKSFNLILVKDSFIKILALLSVKIISKLYSLILDTFKKSVLSKNKFHKNAEVELVSNIFFIFYSVTTHVAFQE